MNVQSKVSLKYSILKLTSAKFKVSSEKNLTTHVCQLTRLRDVGIWKRVAWPRGSVTRGNPSQGSPPLTSVWTRRNPSESAWSVRILSDPANPLDPDRKFGVWRNNLGAPCKELGFQLSLKWRGNKKMFSKFEAKYWLIVGNIRFPVATSDWKSDSLLICGRRIKQRIDRIRTQMYIRMGKT